VELLERNALLIVFFKISIRSRTSVRFVEVGERIAEIFAKFCMDIIMLENLFKI
jgi:hypothetical protein